MKVSLVSVTSWETRPGIGDNYPEDLIAYCARVSSPHRQEDHDSAPRLLKYLIDHGHWSPFEMVDMTVEIETSRAIAAQILRHRSFSFQEFSQRYATASLGAERYEARSQDLKNRQNSLDDMSDDAKDRFRGLQEIVIRDCNDAYELALQYGVAKELARMLLPLSTMTRLYMKGSVRSWIHYLKVRLDPSAQKEHRDVAAAIRDIFKYEFPATHAAAFGDLTG